MNEAKLALVPEPPEPLAEPVVLGGRYRLIRQLVEGGMGSVWYAEHLTLRSPVAVKLIKLDGHCCEESAQRFLLEARAGAALRSPHVVQILDYGLHEGRPFLVMELLVGESLAAYLKRAGPLPAPVTARVISQVARALTRAHDAGVIHRDLKPANIFLVADDDDLLVKLLDFGIAKSFKDSLAPSSAPLSRTGTFIGTPQYASPEQIECVSTLDHRTDIWSMGIVAFECLLNCSPFDGNAVGKIMVDICSQPLPVPSERGNVPAGFDAWFARACMRDPQQRFQSAAEAAAELSRLCLSKEDTALLGANFAAAAAAGQRRRGSGTTVAKYSAVLLSMALAGGALGLTLLDAAHPVQTTSASLTAEPAIAAAAPPGPAPAAASPTPAEQMTAAAVPAEPTAVLPPAAASLTSAALDGGVPSDAAPPSALVQPSAAAEPSALVQASEVAQPNGLV
ncbi:MAG TPA: serine/threonine-protein kinase, partial [Polyangiaceae bacterium]|nr:serine/threonine-protein kinase [Polyangiaceae bacterium]